MAARTAEPTGHHYRPHQQQSQQQHQLPQKHLQQQQQHRFTPKVYTLYPDPPLRRPSIMQHLPPSPSQLQHDKPSKTTYADLTPQSSVSSTKSNAQVHINGRMPLQQQQAYPSSSKYAPPSPVSPSSPASMGFVTPTKGSIQPVHEKQLSAFKQGDRAQTGIHSGSGSTGRYEQSSSQQQQQSRQPAGVSPATRQHLHYQQPHYGGSVPRQSPSSAPAQHQNQDGQAKGHGHSGQEHEQSGAALKQSGSGSSVPSPTSPSSGTHQHVSGTKKNAAPAASSSPYPVSPRQGSSSATHARTPHRSERPSLVTDIPSSSLFLSFDRDADQDHAKDHAKHQRQALQYQQKLQQKPPPKQGEEASDDDSDSGSILSYRRSINRLSMTYKGRPGIPNISLFAPHQRSQVIQHDRSASGSSAVSGSGPLRELKEEKKRQQQQQQQVMDQQKRPHQQQQQQGNSKLESYPSASSLVSIDQQINYHYNQHSKQNQQPPLLARPEDGGRPRVVRAYTEEPSPVSRATEVQIPGRSTSVDNIHTSDIRSRKHQQTQGFQHHQHQQGHHQPYPSNHHPYPTNSTSSQLPLPSSAQRNQYDPRPSHESAQSMRSQYSRNGPAPGQGRAETRGGGALSPNGGAQSQNPLRGANNIAGGMAHHPLPTTARGAAGAGGYGNSQLNMHPAHHLPSGGYVRPEEAVGPSNPMPEKAEDYVRQGIEYHEIGEISKATRYFRNAAEMGDPVGMLMYGLSVRHGWGCTANRVLAFQYLQKSAEHAVGDLNSRDSFASSAAKGELVLAIYELGICFRHGWGVEKNKKTAAYYFEIAANLGDPDAQNDLAWCYYHGVGVKKDMYKSAKYYRLAAAQGLQLIGNQWIWKDKYGGPTSPAPIEKGHSHHHALHVY